MPLTKEEEEKLWNFVVKGKNYIFRDAVEYMKPMHILKLVGNIRNIKWILEIKYCEYCHQQMFITKNFTQRRFCCKEHRILYHNENRGYKKFVCEWCGETFYEYTYRKARFCSKECAGYAREAAKRAKKAEQNNQNSNNSDKTD